MANYFMLGGDGQEYGPVGADQVRQWMAEGRANAQTQLRDVAGGGWMPLGAIPELNAPPGSAGPAAYAPPSQGGAYYGGVSQGAGTSAASPTTQRLANTLASGSGWMKLVAVMMFIGGGLYVLTIWGIIVAWIPIWLGVVLWGTATKAEAARQSGTTADLHKSLLGLRFFYQLAGIFGIVCLCIIPLLLAAMAIPAFAKVRAVSRQKAVLNNLRQLSSAAQTYMLDKDVTHASYTDLVGAGPDSYLHSITSVAGEDYTDLTISQSQTQITISSEAFGTITFEE